MLENQEFRFGQVRGADNTFQKGLKQATGQKNLGVSESVEVGVRNQDSQQHIVDIETNGARGEQRQVGGRQGAESCHCGTRGTDGTACDHEKVSVKL